MNKIIFGCAICNTHECCNNNPEYPNHCEIWTNIDGCCLAQIRRPNHLQRALAWLDRHWLNLAAAGLAASFFICWSLFYLGSLNKASIDALRKENEQIIMEAKYGKNISAKSVKTKRVRLDAKAGEKH